MIAPDYREGAYDFGVATYVGQWMTGKVCSAIAIGSN
jgi:hypothetical protein